MKMKRKFEHARKCTALAIAKVLGAAHYDDRVCLAKRCLGMLAGLWHCGAIADRQYFRLTDNIVDIAFPAPARIALPVPAHTVRTLSHGEQIAEALDRR